MLDRGMALKQKKHDRSKLGGESKEKNQNVILQQIIHNKGISRAQIARETSLSRATVSILTNELIREGLVITNGTVNTEATGRKPTQLIINPNYAQIATLVLRQNEMRFILYNMLLEPIESFCHAIVYKDGFANDILMVIQKESKCIAWEKCIGFCISTSSTILSDTFQLLSTIMKIAPGYNFLQDLRSRITRVPIFASNGSPMLAYAEKMFGRDSSASNLVYINIAEGIGAGIIMDDKLFKGAHGRAGEFGHMSIDMNGPVCPCSKKGCIDCYLKKASILEAFRGCVEVENKITGISISDIRRALDNGEAKAYEVAEDLSDKLAFALSNLVCMFNPQRIVLGGGIQDLGLGFYQLVKEKLMASSSQGTMWARNLSISYTELDDNAENLGIAKYFLDQVFRFPFLRDNEIIV
jgi:N-acetylglucosamine repressor